MLGKDRFQFSSPNAIDAGEMPPSAPTRSIRAGIDPPSHPQDHFSTPSTPLTPTRTIINTSMNFTDARDNAKSFLKDIEVSPTHGSASYVETFRDEDDPLLDAEFGDRGDVKLKTAGDLSSNSSTSTYNSPSERDSLTQPSLNNGRSRKSTDWHRPSRRGRKLTIPSLRQKESRFQEASRPNVKSQPTPPPASSNKLLLCFCLAPVALIVLVSFGISHVFGRDSEIREEINSERPEETVVSGRFLQTIDMLVANGISDARALVDAGSPQTLAAKWIADIDPLQYDIPSKGLPLEESYHFIQRYVLVLFFYGLGGNETWHNSLDFLSQNHECSWYHSKKFTDGEVYAMGVTCRGSDLQVSDLLLPANNLKGSLPMELIHLSHLQLLSLSHNEITGTLPDLRELSSLQYLDLGTNKLSGSIPGWIDTWSQLRVMGFENNRLTGNLPQSLASLTNLITLDLKGNLLQGDVDVINGLQNLEFLYLGQNGFAGFVDSEIFLMDLKAVQEIDISNNLFYGDAFPHSLLRKPNLRVLDISANAFRGSLPEPIEPNSILEVLEINANGFTGTIPSSIENLVNLNHLDMQMNHFVGTIPDRFVNLHHLTYLSLGENDFTPGPIPAFLSSFTKLRELSLARCNLVGYIPDWFDVMENLRFLNLQSNSLEGSIPEPVWNLPDLSIFLLTDNKLTGTVPTQMANIQNFKILTLSGNDFSGEADTLCNAALSIDAFSFDCEEVTCSSDCCNTCCADPQNSSGCHSKQLMTALGKEQNSWEFKYHSNAYSFSPSVIVPMEKKHVPQPWSVGAAP